MANLSSSNPLVALGQQGASGVLNATPGAGNQIFNPSSGQASQGVRSGGGLANGTAGEGNYAGMWWQAGGKTADGQNAVGGWQNGPNPFAGLNAIDAADPNNASSKMESYTSTSPSAPVGSGSSGSGGTGQSGASYPGLSAAMGGLNSSGGGGGASSGGGMNLSGLAGAFGSSVNPGPMVGAPGLGDTAIASAPPQTPDTGFSGSGGSGAQQLSAPTAGRQGIGARIYPSLQALLRTPAY